jgi:formylglycine-generating enzyme required for sulfatase activity
MLVTILGAATAAVEHTTNHASPSTELHYPWQQIDGKHWQIVAPGPIEDPEVTDSAEGTRGQCPAGMVEVQGLMMVDGEGYYDDVEAYQKSTCVSWLNQTFPERCARFDEERWRVRSAFIPRRPMHFCIDRFEYPDRRGAYPWIMVDWYAARDLCEHEGKRLCTEWEWTFACEGSEASPYPYGYERDADACVIDRPWREYDAGALSSKASDKVRAELDRLWQGEASGTRPRCKSPFGAYDMTGNVDEWTSSVVAHERPSILKGGYWAPVRDGCRPSTRVHGEDFAFYQQGFRCCSDVP